MKLPQHSLRGLFGLVLFCAVGLAALSNASRTWAISIFSAAALLLALATIRGIHARGAGQAFYLGFAVCGGLYLLDFLVRSLYPWHPEWITSLLLEYGQPYLVPEALVKDATGRVVAVNGAVLDHYAEIGHSLWALLCGWAGGCVSAYFHTEGSRPDRVADRV